MKKYVTRDGDTVDYIAWKLYGGQPGSAEALYEANRGLADEGLVLPAGITIFAPTLPEAALTPSPLRLWG